MKRKNLLIKANQAIAVIDRLDLYLMDMAELAGGRQPAITKNLPIMIEGHQALRTLWKALEEQL